jgi:hypothetical protein
MKKWTKEQYTEELDRVRRGDRHPGSTPHPFGQAIRDGKLVDVVAVGPNGGLSASDLS